MTIKQDIPLVGALANSIADIGPSYKRSLHISVRHKYRILFFKKRIYFKFYFTRELVNFIFVILKFENIEFLSPSGLFSSSLFFSFLLLLLLSPLFSLVLPRLQFKEVVELCSICFPNFASL